MTNVEEFSETFYDVSAVNPESGTIVCSWQCVVTEAISCLM